MINYRDRFADDMRLRGFSENTVFSYLREVKRFFDRTGKGVSPQKVDEDLIRKYFIHLQQDRKYSPSALKIAYSGMRFFLSRH